MVQAVHVIGILRLIAMQDQGEEMDRIPSCSNSRHTGSSAGERSARYPASAALLAFVHKRLKMDLFRFRERSGFAAAKSTMQVTGLGFGCGGANMQEQSGGRVIVSALVFMNPKIALRRTRLGSHPH